MGSKTRPVHKKKSLNPAKTKMLAKRSITAAQLDVQKERARMLWAMVIAMDETDSLDVDQDTILDIIGKINENMEEYYSIARADGFDIADEKLNRRVNRILGIGDMEDTPEKLYSVDTEEGDQE